MSSAAAASPIAARYGTRTVVATGMVFVAAGLTALSFATATTSYTPYAVALIAIASGMGVSVPSLSTGIMTSLPPARAGMGSGLNSAAREIGAVIGSALGSRFAQDLPAALDGRTESTSQALRETHHLGNAVYVEAIDAFTTAMATGYRVVAIVVLIGAGLVYRGLAPSTSPVAGPAERERIAS